MAVVPAPTPACRHASCAPSPRGGPPIRAHPKAHNLTEPDGLQRRANGLRRAWEGSAGADRATACAWTGGRPAQPVSPAKGGLLGQRIVPLFTAVSARTAGTEPKLGYFRRTPSLVTFNCGRNLAGEHSPAARILLDLNDRKGSWRTAFDLLCVL